MKFMSPNEVVVM